MSVRRLSTVVLGGGLLIALVCGLVAAPGEVPNPKSHLANPKLLTADEENADNDRPADREAIRRSARVFVEAFDNGDAKALAAAWVEKGELFSDNGEVLHGPAAIEKAYTEYF